MVLCYPTSQLLILTVCAFKPYAMAMIAEFTVFKIRLLNNCYQLLTSIIFFTDMQRMKYHFKDEFEKNIP